MVRVVVLGMGMAASHYIVGLERIKMGDIEPYGVPLAGKLPIDISEIEVVGVYDVDTSKVGKSVYEVAKMQIGSDMPIPESLKEIKVYEGVHLRNLDRLGIEARGVEDRKSLSEALDYLVEQWSRLEPDVFINVITTEYATPFGDPNYLAEVIRENNVDEISAGQFYAYAAAVYASKYKPIAYVNLIPTPLANDDAFIKLYTKYNSVLLGDDGATGATPYTADTLEHLRERNRYVDFIVQFNIGGNLDFYALTDPDKNLMKEETKSSIVRDILGYEAPHYIKPTGYLEPLGDKKFVSIHIEYKTFNGLRDSIYVNMRINDSPALAGYMVDLARLGKMLLDQGFKGSVYEVNAFYMKKPGPRGSPSISRIVAYQRLINWLESNDLIVREYLE